jgi:hypothetical protein
LFDPSVLAGAFSWRDGLIAFSEALVRSCSTRVAKELAVTMEGDCSQFSSCLKVTRMELSLL